MSKFVEFIRRWSVVLLLSWMALAGTWMAWHDSMTTDEGIHTASAYLALTRNEFRFDPEHPFLFKYLTALPLFALHINLPANDAPLWDQAKPTLYDSWREARDWSDTWMYQSGNNANLIIFLARLPGVILLTLLGWLVFITTKRWYGEKQARWALFFTAFCPTLLAHGHLTNTDIPLACTFMASLWALWKYFEKPSLKSTFWLALSLGIAFTTKFSAVSLIPITMAWLIYTGFKKPMPARKHIGYVLLMCFIIMVWIWSVYQWKSPLSLGIEPPDYGIDKLRSVLFNHGISLDSAARLLHYILPSAFLKGLILSLGGSYFGRNTFILGMGKSIGVWYYFPTLFFFKTQVIALLILLTGIFLYFKRMIRIKYWQPQTVLLGLAAFIVTFLSVTSKLNLGLRHFSPIFPLFCIALGLLTVELLAQQKKPYIALLIGCLYVLPVLLQLNDLIGFTNIFVWPQSHAYAYFNDSNLDWGQQTQAIATAAADRYPGKIIYGSYPWNQVGLPYYGLILTSFDPQNPPHKVPIMITATQLAEPEYAGFLSITPDSSINKNTFFYVLP